MRGAATDVAPILRTLKGCPPSSPVAATAPARARYQVHALFDGATQDDMVDVLFPLQWVKQRLPDQSTVYGVRAVVRCGSAVCEGLYDPGAARFVASMGGLRSRKRHYGHAVDACLAMLYGDDQLPYGSHDRLFYATMMLLSSSQPMKAIERVSDRTKIWVEVRAFDRNVQNVVRCSIVPRGVHRRVTFDAVPRVME